MTLWQSHDWENFQQALGVTTLRLEKKDPRPLLLIYPLFFGFQYGYIPRGPIIHSKQDLALLKELNMIAQKHRLIFTRMDPEQKIDLPPVRSTSQQPETTLIVDLHLTEEELLQQMKRKGRYNIGLAEKKGVMVKKAQTDAQKKAFVSIFFQLLKKTTERDRFSGHEESYYQTMLSKVKSSEILIAFHEEKPLAAGIFCFSGKRAIYYYGASSNEHREFMAPYLLQWEAIRLAKQRGCTTYDFLGIAGEGSSKDHPWKGITEFKMKFGGNMVTYPQPIDIIHRPMWYNMYRLLKLLQWGFRSLRSIIRLGGF